MGSELWSHFEILTTYIHNWPLQSITVRITAWLPTRLLLVELILYLRDRTYSLTATVKDRFLRYFFMVGWFTLRVFVRNLLRGNLRRNIFFHISFSCLIWDTNPGFTSNKPTHYLLDHGDLNEKCNS